MSKNIILTILGSCSGTEPQKNRHHTSFTIQHNEKLYWFDAGETCSYSAYLAGIDLLATEAIFISHTHMDHIGGLPNLLWTLRKLTRISDTAYRKMQNRSVKIFIPDMDVYTGIMKMLKGTEGNFKTVFSINALQCKDGVIYDENDIQVTALHNLHINSEKPFKSFSFIIKTPFNKIVYSGDIKDINELEGVIENSDVLLMETGHHAVEDICRYLKKWGGNFGKLIFIHHGQDILNNPIEQLRKAKKILGDKVIIAHDGMSIKIGSTFTPEK